MNGLKHDLSKYSKAEFSPSCKYFQGTSSPIVEERKNNYGYSDISIHHTNKNKHHYEYWVDTYKGQLLIKPMPFKYNLEYCLDMISASMTYHKKDYKRDFVLNFFIEREGTYLMHPASKEFVIYCLTEYAKNDFKNIKANIQHFTKKLTLNFFTQLLCKKANIKIEYTHAPLSPVKSDKTIKITNIIYTKRLTLFLNPLPINNPNKHG